MKFSYQKILDGMVADVSMIQKHLVFGMADMTPKQVEHKLIQELVDINWSMSTFVQMDPDFDPIEFGQELVTRTRLAPHIAERSARIIAALSK